MNPLKLPLLNGCTHTLGKPAITITVIILQKISSENIINVLKLQTIHLVVEVFFDNCMKDDDGDVISMKTIMVMMMVMIMGRGLCRVGRAFLP